MLVGNLYRATDVASRMRPDSTGNVLDIRGVRRQWWEGRMSAFLGGGMGMEWVWKGGRIDVIIFCCILTLLLVLSQAL